MLREVVDRVLHSDITTTGRPPWTCARTKMRDNILEHVRDFLPEIAVPRRSVRRRICRIEGNTHGIRSIPDAPYVV
jgi:hypothetical protein